MDSFAWRIPKYFCFLVLVFLFSSPRSFYSVTLIFFILFKWEAALYLCSFVVKICIKNLESAGFHPLPILLGMAKEHILGFSQFSSLPWLSYSMGNPSVILTHEYFGNLWEISQSLSQPFNLSNFQFGCIKFHTGLLNTLNQDNIFSLTTMQVFPIHYKLVDHFLASKATDFYFIYTPSSTQLSL